MSAMLSENRSVDAPLAASRAKRAPPRRRDGSSGAPEGSPRAAMRCTRTDGRPVAGLTCATTALAPIMSPSIDQPRPSHPPPLALRSANSTRASSRLHVSASVALSASEPEVPHVVVVVVVVVALLLFGPPAVGSGIGSGIGPGSGSVGTSGAVVAAQWPLHRPSHAAAALGLVAVLKHAVMVALASVPLPMFSPTAVTATPAVSDVARSRAEAARLPRASSAKRSR